MYAYERNLLVLFGICEQLKEYRWDSSRDLVVGISDPNTELIHQEVDYSLEHGGCIYHGEILSWEDVSRLDFDYIIITDDYIVQQAYSIFEDLGVPREKIIIYEHYVQCVRSHTAYSIRGEAELLSVMESLEIETIVDMDMFFSGGCRFSRDHKILSIPEKIKVYGYVSECPACRERFPIYEENIYQKIFHHGNEFLLKTHDVVLFAAYRPIDSVLQAFQFVKECARYVVFCFRKNSPSLHDFQQMDFSEWGDCQYYTSCMGEICVLKRKEKGDCRLYVVAHRKFECPITLDDSLYQVIQGGKKISPSLGFIGDDTGESISELNPYLNELTALYWMWKNTDHEYIGLLHYRRYLLTKSVMGGEVIHLMDEPSIKSFLRNYDIILGDKYVHHDANKVNLIVDLGVDLFSRACKTVRKYLLARQPEYIPAFDFVIGHQGFYRCHMFVTRKRIMDAYAEWLFSFLLDAVNDFDYSGLSVQEKRILGYIGEQLLNVWLIKQHLRIKEVSMWQLEI